MRRLAFTSAALALITSLLVALLLPHGGDYPAAEFRVWLFENNGFSNWNPNWYGGHETLGYSVLLPPLGALIGVEATLVISATFSAALFANLVESEFGAHARLGAYWFSLAFVTNVLIGRAAFALGVAVALGSLLAWQRGRSTTAFLLATVSALCSPVAAAFLALAGAAGWAAQPKPRDSRVGLFIAAASLGAAALLSVIFSEGGSQPFSIDYLEVIVLSCVVALLSLKTTRRSLRTGTWLYLLVSLTLFIVPNGMGTNIVRLAVLFAGPLLLSAWLTDGVSETPIARVLNSRSLRIVAGTLACLFLLLSQIDPAKDVIANADGDRSVDASYFDSLLAHIPPLTASETVEIVPLINHWESLHAAKQLRLARGWERQLDTLRNDLFYEEEIPPATYCRWLRRNSVRYVALANVRVDFAGVRERELIQLGVSCLALTWSDYDWTLYRVAK